LVVLAMLVSTAAFAVSDYAVEEYIHDGCCVDCAVFNSNYFIIYYEEVESLRVHSPQLCCEKT